MGRDMLSVLVPVSIITPSWLSVCNMPKIMIPRCEWIRWKSVHLHVRERNERWRVSDWQMGRPKVKYTGLRLWSLWVSVPLCVILYCVSALTHVSVCAHMCVYLHVLVYVCCSGGLTVCNQTWRECSPTHSAFIRLTEGETVKGEKGSVYACMCV